MYAHDAEDGFSAMEKTEAHCLIQYNCQTSKSQSRRIHIPSFSLYSLSRTMNLNVPSSRKQEKGNIRKLHFFSNLRVGKKERKITKKYTMSLYNILKYFIRKKFTKSYIFTLS